MMTTTSTTTRRPTVSRLFAGETVVCMASGPSLIAEDVDAVRGKARVIAVNDAVRLAPFADVLYSSDLRWWSHYRGVPTFDGLKYSIEQVAGPQPDRRRGGFHWDDVMVLRNTGAEGLEASPDGLRNGRNSGAAAIGLAVHLGATRIVLLGYDMGTDHARTSHFFGDHPAGLRSSSPYQTFIRHFETMVAPLQARGVEVINCTRTTHLLCFPRRPLAEVLS